MGQYREAFFFIGNISVGSEYLPIIRDDCISKVQTKVSDKVEENNEPGIIYGCDISGQV